MSYNECQWQYHAYSINIPSTILDRLNGFRQTISDSLEAGGLLLGRRIINTKDSVVDEITSPLPGDIQNRYSFFRGERHNIFQKAYWEKTNSTGQVLGAWHTHPESFPTPSSIDYKDWSTLVKSCSRKDRPLFFLIVGQQSNRIWISKKYPLGLTQYKLCESVRG